METIHSDVIICGGGTAGLPAALAAARAGARVCIVEEDARIGGASADQYIQFFCGAPYQGIFHELKEKMKQYAPFKKESTFRHSSLIMAYMDWFRDLPVSIYTRQRITRVDVRAGVIHGVESEAFRFEGKVYIDATGDGDVAALAGCTVRYGREARAEFDEAFAPEQADDKVQRCTLMYTVKRRPDAGHSQDANAMAPLDEEEGLIWGPTVICKDTTDETQLNAAQNEALRMLSEKVAFWRDKGYYITAVAPKLGVRESRRIEGLHILSYRDIAEEKTFEDSVCVVNYNIDPWDPDGNPVHDKARKQSTFMPDYEIPYRCLVNRQVENLIVAGRCISATHVANSSLRVMGICIPVGQAAGNAAFLALQQGCPARDVNTQALRALQRQGGVHVSKAEPMPAPPC